MRVHEEHSQSALVLKSSCGVVLCMYICSGECSNVLCSPPPTALVATFASLEELTMNADEIATERVDVALPLLLTCLHCKLERVGILCIMYIIRGNEKRLLLRIGKELDGVTTVPRPRGYRELCECE